MYTDFKRKLSQTLWSLLKHTNFIEKLIHILCSLCWGFHEKQSIFICTWLFLMQTQSKYGRFTFGSAIDMTHYHESIVLLSCTDKFSANTTHPQSGPRYYVND
jgi:hypothetical protein